MAYFKNSLAYLESGRKFSNRILWYDCYLILEEASTNTTVLAQQLPPTADDGIHNRRHSSNQVGTLRTEESQTSMATQHSTASLQKGNC